MVRTEQQIGLCTEGVVQQENIGLTLQCFECGTVRSFLIDQCLQELKAGKFLWLKFVSNCSICKKEYNAAINLLPNNKYSCFPLPVLPDSRVVIIHDDMGLALPSSPK